MVTLRRNRREGGFTFATQEIGYQGIRRGDLVIHAMDAFAGAIGVSDSDGKSTPVYAACTPIVDLNSWYYCHLLRYLAHSGYIETLAKGIRERSTEFRFAEFASLSLPVPPTTEQDAIVRFLEEKERDIERYIATKRRMIEVLEERRRTVITKLMTQGIHSDEDTCVREFPWSIRHPIRWEAKRAKQLCLAIIDCKNRTPQVVEGGEYMVIRTSNVRDGRMLLDDVTTTDRANYVQWTMRGPPKRGDVFFTREAPAGEACLVPEDCGRMCMGQRMMYFRPDPEKLDPEFLLYSIYAPVVQGYIQATSQGSTVAHLRLGQVYSLPLLWCPLAEQRQIAQQIREQTKAAEEAIAALKKEVSAMKEYRTRLIADAVTGQIDVRSLG